MVSIVPRIEEGPVVWASKKLSKAKKNPERNVNPAIHPSNRKRLCCKVVNVGELRFKHMTTNRKKIRTAPAYTKRRMIPTKKASKSIKREDKEKMTTTNDKTL